MTDHLDATLHSETLPINALLVQNATSSGDGTACDLRVNYDSDSESEKPILLELGASSNIARTTKTTTMTELCSVPYSNNYPLDIHLNSVYVSGTPTVMPSYSTDHALLYNNPYNSGISSSTTATTNAPQLSQHTSLQTSTNSPSLTCLNDMPYSAHIPQTVYTWATSTPLTSITPTEVNKLPMEIVPPPIYMSYPDTRRHTISKQTNPVWKEKALQTEKDYKKTACDRERTRMRDMNRAFDLLRSKLPISKPNGKKYSKIESLRIAINYINHLQKILDDNTMDQTNLTVAKYLSEFNIRRRSNSNRYENHKSNTFEDANDKLRDLDESRSTWSDGYIP